MSPIPCTGEGRREGEGDRETGRERQGGRGRREGEGGEERGRGRETGRERERGSSSKSAVSRLPTRTTGEVALAAPVHGPPLRGPASKGFRRLAPGMGFDGQ